MASVTHHEDGRQTFVPDGHPDDPLAALLAEPRTSVLRTRGAFIDPRSIVGPAPWVPLRIVLVVAAVLVCVAAVLGVRG